MVSDPYKILGVSQNATQDEIKKAYRKKARECHPDLNPDDPKATERMNEVNEAYDMLMNPEKYRNQRASNTSSAGQSYSNTNQGGYSYGTGGFDFEDMFGFGFGSYQNVNVNPQVQPTDSDLVRQAIYSINSRDYNTALHKLMLVPSTERNGRWYYLSDLLGDIVDPIEDRNTIAEQLARINEQLVIKNNRAKKIWQILLGVLVAIIFVIAITILFFLVDPSQGSTTITESTEIIEQ